MKRICFIFLSIILLLFACTKFEIMNTIHPKAHVHGDRIGLKYNLGPIPVSDSFTIKPPFVQLLKENIDNIELDLTVSYNAEHNPNTWFYYYLNGFLIGRTKNVISAKILLQNQDSIPGFFISKEKVKNKKTTDKIKKEEKPIKTDKDSSETSEQTSTNEEFNKL